MNNNKLRFSLNDVKSVLAEAVMCAARNKRLTEGNNFNGVDTHFAVNKSTNLIVNSWDYSDYDAADLRSDKNYYFSQDLEDNGFNPKDYKILTYKVCVGRGIDPSDDANWSNDGQTPCIQQSNESKLMLKKLVNEALDEMENDSFYDEEDIDGQTGQKGQVKSYELNGMSLDRIEAEAEECGQSVEDYLRYWWEEIGSDCPFTWQTLGRGYGFHGDEICRVGNVIFKDIYGQVMADESAPQEQAYNDDFNKRLNQGEHWTK